MNKHVYDVGIKFHNRPIGRKLADGEFSGEAFRQTVLLPFFNDVRAKGSKDVLVLNFNNVSMAGSSFLEEAFGGLVRAGFSKSFIKDHLEIIVDWELKELISDRIYQYIDKA
ncbi:MULTISPECIES: STAS-like domain-containing protein [Acinetobacter]|uniref:STAS-like domain-containing protein n=1 Tax=Acinetobacter TaxID=469 RepID=UPI000C3CE423|nr:MULTISPECIES: STAS-like domain-containing protein [unclassified Acinetobacter]MBC69734.1 hypothetical protein [Acinetobacter sp.]|tara:strand:- start:1659 stop:1994 length:336 start_codon:yes stop_codon:yes gene_type:complete